ncbi:MAG: hypothetical protein AB7P49_03795 [Bdellovibrionales bacterium]
MFFYLQSSASELWLQVGEVRRLTASPETMVRVGSRGVIKVVDAGEAIQVIGLKAGSTTLVLDGRTHLVRVSLSQQKRFAEALRAAVREMMGLNVSIDSKEVEIGGTLLRFSDWLHLTEIARTHQGQYRFRAQALPDVAEEALSHLQELARTQGYPILRFTAQPGFTAHLPHAAKSLRPAVERSFAPFGIHVETSAADLAVQPLVRTRVVLAEVSKQISQELGVRWPAEYQAQVLPQAKDAGGMMLALRALEARGQAQILASPTLLCRSGGEARFHAGGEFPIRMISRQSHGVIWKPHGVLLSVKPKADFQGTISLEIETEVSLLDMAGAVDGVPAIKKNTVRSHFDLPGRRTIALSGLLRQELGENREGLPFLTRIPILGALFSSQKYLNHRSELVVFVTPEIHSPETDEPVKMPEGWIPNEH